MSYTEVLLATCETVPNEKLGTPCLIDHLHEPGQLHSKIGGKYSHRQVWEEANGPLPDGMVIHHQCGNHRCVQIAHLKPVTRSRHSSIHKPKKLWCAKHRRPIDGRTKKGDAICKRCKAEADARYRARKKLRVTA